MLTGGEDAVDELLLGDSAVLIPVNAPEDVQNTRLHVAYPLDVSLAPDIEVKVRKLLQLI